MVFYPVSDTTFVSCLQTLNLVQYGTLQWVVFEWKEHVKVILWRFISVACVVLVPGHYRVSVDSIGTCPSSVESFGTWPECSCLKRTGGALFDSADGPKSLSLTLSLSPSICFWLSAAFSSYSQWHHCPILAAVLTDDWAVCFADGCEQ